MSVYTERFAAHSAAAIGQTVIYTVPAGKRAVLMTCLMVDRAGVANLLRLRLLTAGDDPMLIINNVPAGGSSQNVNLRLALNAGDQLEFYRGAAADCTVGGYLFDAP